MVEEIDEINRDIHIKTLIPSSYCQRAGGYEPRLGGKVTLGVAGTEGKDYWDMEKVLKPENMSYSTRLDSIVGLNLQLLLTGKHSLEGDKWLRDARGMLCVDHNELDADDDDGFRPYDSLRFSASASPNKK